MRVAPSNNHGGYKYRDMCPKPMGARVHSSFNTFRLGGNMVQYKVDWLAFSIKFASEDIDPFSLDLFEELGYDLENLKKRLGDISTILA